MKSTWSPGRRPGRDVILPGLWLRLLKKAAEGSRVVYGLMLLEERYPTEGPLREKLLGSLLLEVRVAARAAIRYLELGGSVPAYLLDLRHKRESRERERAQYRARACRTNLALLPKDDRGWQRKRLLRQELYRRQRRTQQPSGMPEFVVVSSWRGTVLCGLDRVRADREFSEAVRHVEARGEGAVALMRGSKLVENYTLGSKLQGQQR